MSDSDENSAPSTPGSHGSNSPIGSPASGSIRSPSPASNASGSAPASPQSIASPIASPTSSHSGYARSRSASPASGPQSPTSHGSGSPARSRSPGSHGSPTSHRSGSPGSHRSGSPGSHRSMSPAGSVRSRSPSASPAGSHHSRSASPTGSIRSRSPTPIGSPGSVRSARSGSRSPAGSARSGSRSPVGSTRSRSRSPAGSARSGPRSPVGSARSGSRSPAGSIRSRSRSPAGSRSRSASPARSGSRTPIGSPGSVRSRSRSPARSGSGSPHRSRSRSASPAKSWSEAGSPHSARSGSASPGARAGSKKARIVDSDEEAGSGKEEITATADDLFGDASDISSDEGGEEAGSKAGSDKGSQKGSDAGSGDEQRRGPVIEDDENENQEPEEIPETRIEVEIPKVNTDLGKAIHFVKLPNFLSVETRPFDPMTYEDEVDDEDVMDEEGRTRLRLKVENTMRWRPVKDEEGNEVKDEFEKPVRESNARVVKWSDGSMSLHLGNEIFDVHTMLLQGDYNHLFIRQGTGLQGQAVFRTKLSFRPHSTDSFTHKKMTMSLADRSLKKQKLKVLPIAGADPESHRSEMIKKEEERLRASVRRDAQQKRMKERAHSRGMSAGYLQDDADDDDENSFSIGALKRAYKDKKGARGHAPIYSSDDDDDDSDDSFSEDEKKSKKLMKAKRLADSDEESTGSRSSGSDSQSEESPKKKIRIESSDDEGSGGGSSPKSLEKSDSD